MTARIAFVAEIEIRIALARFCIIYSSHFVIIIVSICFFSKFCFFGKFFLHLNVRKITADFQAHANFSYFGAGVARKRKSKNDTSLVCCQKID